MRLSLIFFMLILLPVATGVHAWLFCRDNLPRLTQEAVSRLKAAGISDPVVEVRFFDISVTGEAPDPNARESAVTAIRSLVPLRLQLGADRLHVKASLDARLESNTLRLTGWLPEERDVTGVKHLLAELRPDLVLNTDALLAAPEVRWPEGMKQPLTANASILKPVLEMLQVRAELHVEAGVDTITIKGWLPSRAAKEELVAALVEVAGSRVIDPGALKTGPHVLAAGFEKHELLAVFLRSYFVVPGPRSFDIMGDGSPRMVGVATRQMESEWLALLRPVTGAAKVDAKFDLVPSIYHFPGYQPRTALPADVLDSLREVLRASGLEFEAGSARISPELRSKLAGLAPLLLAAGPTLRLVIGAHPDPNASMAVEDVIGRQRAEAVLSFLVEQGVPSADISAVVFDPVPVGSPAAPTSLRSVELVIK